MVVNGQADVLDPIVFKFFVVFVMLIDRTPYVRRPGAISFMDVPFIARGNAQVRLTYYNSCFVNLSLFFKLFFLLFTNFFLV